MAYVTQQQQSIKYVCMYKEIEKNSLIVVVRIIYTVCMWVQVWIVSLALYIGISIRPCLPHTLRCFVIFLSFHLISFRLSVPLISKDL